MMTPRPPLVLAVLDGWGSAPAGRGNAIASATTPNLQHLAERYPTTTISASGADVGLLDGQEGNSEAGHMNLGAGRIVRQNVRIISDAVADKSFFKNPALLKAFAHAKGNGRIHLMGLLSGPESPHSNPEHLRAILTFAREQSIHSVFLHLFTDGRDSQPYDARTFMKTLTMELAPNERVATVMGRAWGMDRKKDWKRTAAAYDALVQGKGERAHSPSEALESAYIRGETDEFILPTIIVPDGRMRDGDTIIFFNFRPDRARQITKAFVQPDFSNRHTEEFSHEPLTDLCFATLVDFGPELPGVLAAYPEVKVSMSLPFALKDLRQLYVGESEKFAHVTYFFNGGHEGTVAGERQVRIPSPDVLHYETSPAMSARGVADAVIAAIHDASADFMCCNFANADMLGHTGNLPAAVAGVEEVDRCIGDIVIALERCGGTLLVTGDHGNAEAMLDAAGDALTEHTANPVPLIVADPSLTSDTVLASGGVLGDVAPTILKLLNCAQPREMTGRALV